MAEYWYNNGQSVQSLGMVGYTGSSRYVVVYQFIVGINGCSSVSINLSNFYSFQGSNQTVSCKIGTSPSQYAAGTATPDGTGTMSYGSSWGCNITCSVNLPAGTYYAAIYVTGASGYWRTVYANAASISTSGSYTPTEVDPTFSSVSNPVNTGSNVVVNMTNPSNVSVYVEFYYNGTLLERSASFTRQLSHTCPRMWFQQNISVTSISIQLKIYKSNGTLLDQSRSFTLNADSGMVPIVVTQSFTATKINTGSIDEFISSLTKIQIDFARSNDAYVANMSNTAHAEVRSVWIEYNGIIYDDHETGYPYRYKTSSITGSGYVRICMEDSRGRKGYYDYVFVAYPYTPPIIKSATVVRCNNGFPYTPSETGTICTVNVCCSYTDIGETKVPRSTAYYSDTELYPSAGYTTEETPATRVTDEYGTIVVNGTTYYVHNDDIVSRNSLRYVVVMFKETSGQSYNIDRTITAGNGNTTGKIKIPCCVQSGTGKLDPSKTYMIQLAVQDEATSTQLYVYYLAFEKWMLCFTNTGDGCGIGQAPGSDNVLQIPNTWEFLAGSMRTGNDRMVLVEGKHYGTQAQMDAITNPMEGQIFYVLTS